MWGNLRALLTAICAKGKIFQTCWRVIWAIRGQPDATLHIEAFYRYQMTDNISLTPGVIVLVNPDNTAGSDTITIGALRTTFRF